MTFDATGTELIRTKDLIRASRRRLNRKTILSSLVYNRRGDLLPVSIAPVTWSNAAMSGQGTNLEKWLGTNTQVK